MMTSRFSGYGTKEELIIDRNRRSGRAGSRSSRQRHKTRVELAISLVLIVIALLAIFFLNRPMTASASQEKTYQECYRSIEINPGDTLYKLADQYKKDPSVSRRQYVNKIIETNHLTSQNIYSGMSLVVPVYAEVQ